jgi:23S rRNA pseudouridine1911/1915/1917 synthase
MPADFQFVVDDAEIGQRLDVVLAARLSQHSRTSLRRAINAGCVLVDGRNRKPSHGLRGGENVSGSIPDVEPSGPLPEQIPLDIIFEDDDLVAINKPSGMVVHPAKGHWAGTLTSALAFHFQQLSHVGGAHRPGIVHRLDRDTSGVIVVAKNDRTHLGLARQFEQREVEKEYYAICRGSIDRDRDWIRQPIGVHPYQREKMAIREGHSTSRDAATFFEVDERWNGFTSFRVLPRTGRTHQIRVHLAHIGCPVLCDPLYSGHRELTRANVDRRVPASSDEVVLDRLALHSRRLKITHPTTAEVLVFEADIPRVLRDVTRILFDARSQAEPLG